MCGEGERARPRAGRLRHASLPGKGQKPSSAEDLRDEVVPGRVDVVGPGPREPGGVPARGSCPTGTGETAFDALGMDATR